jgi:hypothetical protein
MWMLGFVAIQKSSRSHLSAAILSRNNKFLLIFLLIRDVWLPLK